MSKITSLMIAAVVGLSVAPAFAASPAASPAPAPTKTEKATTTVKKVKKQSAKLPIAKKTTVESKKGAAK